MTRTIFTKKSLAIAVSAMSLALVGCDKTPEEITEQLGANTSTVESTFVHVNAPKGSITGLVQDTNGLPIEGATVYFAGQSQTTDAGGQYYFEEVQVTQTTKLGIDNGGYSQAVSLTIVPPAGYLGATVTVYPTAQIFESDTSANTEGGETNPIVTFVDGFLAGAGTAVLPAESAVITGVLRDVDSGAPLANVDVAFDVVSINSVAQQQDQDGVDTSYASAVLQTTTDSEGNFRIENVPADASLVLTVENYELDNPAQANVATTAETPDVNIGNLYAALIDSTDTVAPFVKSVQGVLNQAAGVGQLNDDVLNTISIKFSEPLLSGAIDTNSILVRDVDTGNYLTTSSPTLVDDVLTLSISPNLVAGSEIHVLLLVSDFLDQAAVANHLTTGASVGYDSSISTSVGSQYIRLALQVYQEANTDATAVNLASAQLVTDDSGVDSIVLEQEGYDAFMDVDDNAAGIQQLNAADNDDAAAGADTAERLSALGNALAGSAGLVGSATVEVDVARIRFAVTTASYYEVDVTDADGNSKWAGLASKTAEAGADLTGITLTPDGTGSAIELLLNGVEPGDMIFVTPYDDFGYKGTIATLTLVDNIAPTTILQSAYGVSLDNNTGSVTLTYGDGGELAGDGSSVLGLPVLNITPRLLALAEGDADGTDAGGVAGLSELVDLFEQNTVNEHATNTISATLPGDAFIDPALGIYDSNAFADYSNPANGFLERKVGVAFSEDVVSTGTDPVYTPTGVTVDGWEVMNDITLEDDGDTVNADLMTFDVDNVIAWSLNNHNTTIDFTSAVEDSQGNSASGKAMVVVRDALPPMIASAEYTGDQLELVFNEAVDLSDTPVVDLGGTAITLDLATTGISQSVDLKTITIENTVWGGDLNHGATFSLTAYNEDSPGAASIVNGAFGHAPLDFSQVNDSNGNNWDDYTAAGDATFTAPLFAAENLTGIFEDLGAPVVNNFTSGRAVGETFTVEWSFSHEIDMTSLGVAADATSLNSAQVNTAFTLDTTSGGTSTIDTTDTRTTAVLSADRKTITVTIVVGTGAITGGNTFDFTNNVRSDYDSSLVHNADAVTAS